MFVITNRALKDKGNGLEVFAKTPNPSGPNELRMVSVKGKSNFTVDILKDKLPKTTVSALIAKYKLNINPDADWFASLEVACELFDAARKEEKHVLLFVHGYNNDLKDVLKTAHEIQDLYNVIVVPFSWPANGGGQISGASSYLSDKDDARSSSTALHRAVEKLAFYHKIMTEGTTAELRAQADQKHPDDHERARALFMRLVEKQCRTSVNLLCHSMGSYLLKYATKPSNSSLRQLSFDNISIVAADANNPGHEEWVQNLPARNRVYVVINEDDYALKWSRRKPGDAQEERLGHHLKNLIARNAYYLDVTRSKGVGKEHSYFKGSTIRDNATLRRMFARAFEGGRAETGMEFHADLNVYRS